MHILNQASKYIETSHNRLDLLITTKQDKTIIPINGYDDQTCESNI
jgi:hypothetical protein